MKKTCPIFIALFLALSACSYTNKQEISESTEENIDVALFEKKQACAEYQDAITEKLNSQYFYVEETGFEGFYALEKVFYSQKEDSCLYIARESDFEYGVYTYEHLTMIDVLTGEMLLASLLVVGEVEYLEREKAFYATVSEYE